MKNLTKWTTMAAVLALSTSLAIAAPHGPKGEGRHGRGGMQGEHGMMEERLAQKLNLTDAQKEQIKALRASFREQNKTFFETARTTREQFREAKKAGDTAKADALKATMETQRTQMQHLRQQQHTEIAKLLTPEQRKQFDELKAKMEERREKRGGRGGHGGHRGH
jgi:protein CpxP